MMYTIEFIGNHKLILLLAFKNKTVKQVMTIAKHYTVKTPGADHYKIYDVFGKSRTLIASIEC